MEKRTIIITEDISEPVDEGIKKYSFHLIKHFIDHNKQNLVFSSSSNNEMSNIELLPKNKFFISISFFKKIYSFKPQLLIYIPFSSSTLMSFIRLKLVSMFCISAKIIMVSLQKRKHNYLSKLLITLLKPNEIIVLSKKEAYYYQHIGFKSIVSPIGVDTNKFTEVNFRNKKRLRNKLNLPVNNKIILHVGHITKGRNIDSMKVLLSQGYKIVIIGSTRFESNFKLKQKLEIDGYIFITNYVEKIEEYYQASDIYMFPVKSFTGAMEFPLSIFEAMSCNLPIITTNFGGLDTYISESDDFKYYNNEIELSQKVDLLYETNECQNRKIILKNYSWDKVFSIYLAK